MTSGRMWLIIQSMFEVTVHTFCVSVTAAAMLVRRPCARYSSAVLKLIFYFVKWGLFWHESCPFCLGNSPVCNYIVVRQHTHTHMRVHYMSVCIVRGGSCSGNEPQSWARWSNCFASLVWKQEEKKGMGYWRLLSKLFSLWSQSLSIYK